MTLSGLLVVSSLFSSLFASNPIISHKYTADPSALVYKGRVYVYCSHDDNNSMTSTGSVDYRIVDYTLISSDDMVNWTDHGEVFNAKKNTTWASLAFAPSCIERNGKCYLYFPDGGNSIGVAVADLPEGPFTDPLGKSLVNRNMPNCDVEWCFDPCAFIDTTGQAYLYFGGGMNTVGTNLRVIKLNADMISTSGTAVTLEAKSSFEASYMHTCNGKYYFSYATDGASRIDYLMSVNPMSGFQYKGTILENPTLNGQNINRNNNNHASIVMLLDKWYMFYHDRRLSCSDQFRNVCVDLLTYAADGTIPSVKVTAESVTQIKFLNPYDTVQAETMDNQKGIKTDVCSEGGIMVDSISNGDYTSLSGVDFGPGATKFEIRASSASSGGNVEIRLGSETGTLVGNCPISGTGGWTTWKTFICDVSECLQVKNVYFVYKGNAEPFRLNWFRFIGATGVKVPPKHCDRFSRKEPFSLVSLDHMRGSPETYSSVHSLLGRTVAKTTLNNFKNTSNGMYLVKDTRPSPMNAR
jgi:arabinoxylan arabinofuranohydrolase